MWNTNQNTTDDSTVSENRTRQVPITSGSNTGLSGKGLNNKIIDIVDTDSGFISGPQTAEQFYSEELSENFDNQIQHPDTDLSNKIIPSSTTESGYIDENIDSKTTEATTYTESGYIEGDAIEEDFIEEKVAPQISTMLLKETNEIILPDLFYNLGIKEMNNLNKKQYGVNNGGNKCIEATSPHKTIDDFSNQPWIEYFQQTNEGDTNLHLAITQNITRVVDFLISVAQHPFVFDIQNNFGQTALHLAVLTSQPTVVRSLLLSGAEPSLRDCQGNTPLHLACINTNIECVDALTRPIHKSEINIDRLYSHPCRINQTDFELRNYDGERCVHIAAQKCQIDIMKFLVRYGADINAREGKSGFSPLHIAIEQGNKELIQFLLFDCNKLQLETTTYAGLTAYQMAMLYYQPILPELRKCGAKQLSLPESDSSDEDSDDFDDTKIVDYFGIFPNTMNCLTRGNPILA